MVLSIYPTVLALTLPRSRLWCCEAKPEFHFCNFCVACDLWNFHLLSTLCFLYHLFKVDFCVIMGKILTYSTCNIKSKSFFFNLFGGIRSHSSWMTKIRSADFSFRDCFFATLSSNRIQYAFTIVCVVTLLLLDTSTNFQEYSMFCDINENDFYLLGCVRLFWFQSLQRS